MIWWPETIPTLTVGTTTLRPMRPTDAEDIYKAVQDPEIPKFTTLPADYPIDLAIEFATTRNVTSHLNKTELVFVIEDAMLATKANKANKANLVDSDNLANKAKKANSAESIAVHPYSNGFAGVMSLHTIDIPNHRAEIGYWLAKEARGFGICTKAAELITEYGLMTMGFKRIDGIVDVGNEPSKAALLKAGYEFEGIMKSYVTRRDGSQLDMALFAATR